MPLKIYRDKKSRNSTIFVDVDGKDVRIEFIGGTVSYSNNTGCYVTNDLKIQQALESRKDFCKGGLTDDGNFYIENTIETDEEIKAKKYKAKKVDDNPNMIIESKNADNNESVGEYENILNDMVKEQLNITTPEQTETTETTSEEVTEITDQTTTPEEPKTDEVDLTTINNYMGAKHLMIRKYGATPDEVKNKESLLAFCKSKGIELPNLK